MVAGLNELFQRVGDQTLFAVAAVVGHQAQFLAHAPEFILQNHQVTAAEAHHAVHRAAQIVQLFGHGISDGAPHASAHDANLFEPLRARGGAQRSHQVMQTVACVQGVQLHGAGTHDLVDHGDGTRLAVIVGHGKGDALALFLGAQDNKLPRLGFAGDAWRRDGNAHDRWIQCLFGQNFKHTGHSLSAAKHSISTSPPLGRAATCTQLRAGGSESKKR